MNQRDAANRPPAHGALTTADGADAALRALVIRHCKWMRTLDADCARAAYQHYRELLPWLHLPPPAQRP